MFNDVADKVFIDQAFSLLAGIHQALFTDPIDPARDSSGLLVDIIQCFIREDVLPAAGISQMGLDVPLCFGTVQVRKDTVDIDPLPDSSVPLHPEFIPQFRLPHKHKRHRADGIKAVIQQKANSSTVSFSRRWASSRMQTTFFFWTPRMISTSFWSCRFASPR